MKELRFETFPALGYAANEAINTLVTNLSFSGDRVRKVVITSCNATDGKTFISMNIMRNLASLGKTVCLVDADLRRSRIRGQYGIRFASQGENPGLSHYLAGMVPAEEIIYRTDFPGAFMVPVGKDVVNSLPLLTSERFGELMNMLADRVDYVIVDAPPAGAIIDAAEIARSCDGSLIVVPFNRVHRKELQDAVEQMRQTGTPVLGTVLNRVEYDTYLSKKYYYKYDGYHRYNSEEEKTGK